MSNKEIGKHIRSLRKKQGITITQLAEKSGVSHSYISQIENGKFNPSPEILRKLSEPLGVSYEDLMVKAGYLIDRNSPEIDVFIIVPLILDLLKEMHEENQYTRSEISNFKEAIFDFLNDKISMSNLKRHLYDLEPDNEIVPRLGSWEKTEKLERLLNLLDKAVKEDKFYQSLLQVNPDGDYEENLASILPAVKGIEEIAIKHFTDLKNTLETDYKPILSDELPIITFNGHPLTKQDRKRILGMLELMFPEYSGQNDDDDDNHDDNDDM